MRLICQFYLKNLISIALDSRYGDYDSQLAYDRNVIMIMLLGSWIVFLTLTSTLGSNLPLNTKQ